MSERGRAAPLPVDPDVLARPVHLRPAYLLTVLAGGLLGTPARYGVAQLWPARTGGWPTGTFVANLVGAFLLGALLEVLARHGDDTGRRRLLRLGLGTGFLGSFTTYSALAVESDLLVRAHRPGLAVTYGLATVVAGLALSAAGIAVAGRR